MEKELAVMQAAKEDLEEKLAEKSQQWEDEKRKNEEAQATATSLREELRETKAKLDDANKVATAATAKDAAGIQEEVKSEQQILYERLEEEKRKRLEAKAKREEKLAEEKAASEKKLAEENAANEKKLAEFKQNQEVAMTNMKKFLSESFKGKNEKEKGERIDMFQFQLKKLRRQFECQLDHLESQRKKAEEKAKKASEEKDELGKKLQEKSEAAENSRKRGKELRTKLAEARKNGHGREKEVKELEMQFHSQLHQTNKVYEDQLSITESQMQKIEEECNTLSQMKEAAARDTEDAKKQQEAIEVQLNAEKDKAEKDSQEDDRSDIIKLLQESLKHAEKKADEQLQTQIEMFEKYSEENDKENARILKKLEEQRCHLTKKIDENNQEIRTGQAETMKVLSEHSKMLNQLTSLSKNVLSSLDDFFPDDKSQVPRLLILRPRVDNNGTSIASGFSFRNLIEKPSDTELVILCAATYRECTRFQLRELKDGVKNSLPAFRQVIKYTAAAAGGVEVLAKVFGVDLSVATHFIEEAQAALDEAVLQSTSKKASQFIEENTAEEKTAEDEKVRGSYDYILQNILKKGENWTKLKEKMTKVRDDSGKYHWVEKEEGTRQWQQHKKNKENDQKWAVEAEQSLEEARDEISKLKSELEKRCAKDDERKSANIVAEGGKELEAAKEEISELREKLHKMVAKDRAINQIGARQSTASMSGFSECAVLAEGYLYKKGKGLGIGGLSGSWMKRKVVLQSDGKLYWESEDKSKKRRGFMQLPDEDDHSKTISDGEEIVNKIETKNKKFYFTLSWGEKTIEFRSDDRNSRDAWVNILNKWWDSKYLMEEWDDEKKNALSLSGAEDAAEDAP